MSALSRHGGESYCEEVSLRAAAEQWGTPLYIYSRSEIERRFQAYQQALHGQKHLICYAVKANSNIAVLNVLAQQGAGFDIVSGGELERVLRAGGDPGRTVFSGVGKRRDEIEFALSKGILCFNVESEAELTRINEIAGQLDIRAPVSLRVNPDVDAGTHPYISTGLRENKFGIDITQAPVVYQRAKAMTHVELAGIDCHIGSQLTEIAPFIDALGRVLALLDQLQADGINIRHLDLGGGLGVRYKDESPPPIADYVKAIRNTLGHRDLTLILEPGRSIVAEAGLLLTRVEYLKSNGELNFAIVDAAMNDMLRPALYEAWMDIEAVSTHSAETGRAEKTYQIVGPICETGDFLGKNRLLSIDAGDLLVAHGAGAYGMSMSSNYNSRPRAAEVMVDKTHCHLIRSRESLGDLMRGEQLIPANGG